MCTATHDFFDIRGSWNTFREAKRFYTRLGYSHRVDLVEADEKHGFTMPLRTASVRWMRRWLLGKDDEIIEPEFPIWKDEEVQCSPQGQVMLMPGERSVVDLNLDLEKQLAVQRRQFWQKTPRAEALTKVREIAGIRPLGELPPPKHRNAGTIQRQGYRIEKLVIEPEPGILLPALLFVPSQPDADAFLYLHANGKQADAAVGGPIEQLVAQGHVVLAPDLRGIGETQNKTPRWSSGRFGPVGEFWVAYFLGKSLVGLWAEDALQCARFLQNYPAAGQPKKTHLVGVGATGLPALHAAALEPELFTSLTLRRTLTSWSDVVSTPTVTHQLVHTVHGALKTYDLPDLVASLGKDKVKIEEPVDALAQPAK